MLPEDLPDEQALALPPASELLPIRSTSVAFARALSEKLSEAGLPHRIDNAPETQQQARAGTVAIYVLPADRERAIELDQEFMREQIPDMPDASPDEVPDEDRCPACAEPLMASTTECPSCGLFLGEPG